MRDIGTFLGYIMIMVLLGTGGCYSFKGISIPPEANTFYISELRSRVPGAPADLGQQFSENLKQKFLNQSRLNFVEIDPDIEFSGEITRFAVTSVAPQPGETTAFNRLEIGVRMKYVYHLDEEENWENSFSFYQDFSRDENLLDVQDGLITIIFQQLAEDIFNKAFTNW
ncbi:MAG: hypothetical protein KDC53_00510 [Saprospiraceae bacterium]|nr:hypothetical protein [Saprospiraceae bacterium]